jgi:hypothetical protein
MCEEAASPAMFNPFTNAWTWLARSYTTDARGVVALKLVLPSSGRAGRTGVIT